MSIPYTTLQKYREYGDVLVETGTYRGDTVAMALNLGFRRVVSIEFVESLFLACVDRFRNTPAVTLLHGRSKEKLPEVLQGIDTRCVFWLDAHYSYGYGDDEAGVAYCPVLDELGVIGKHHIKDHCILIDDIRLIGQQFGNLTLEQLQERILEINPEYRLSFDFGFTADDILVARI